MTAWHCQSCGTLNGDTSAICARCGGLAPPGAGPAVIGAGPGGAPPANVGLGSWPPVPDQPPPPYQPPSYQPQPSVDGTFQHPLYVDAPTQRVESAWPQQAPPPPPPPVEPQVPAPVPPRDRKMWLPVGTAVAGFLALAITAALILPGSPFRLSALAGDNGGPGPATSTAPTSGRSTGPATPPPTEPAPPSASPTSTKPVAVGGVTLDPTVTDPRAVAVATMLDSHYTGINNKDYPRALAAYDPAGAVDPTDPDDVAKFTNGVSTTRDSEMVLRSVGPPTGGKGVLEARVTLRSEQQAGYGPKERPNETCTRWDVTYILTEPATGQYRIYGSRATNSGC